MDRGRIKLGVKSRGLEKNPCYRCNSKDVRIDHVAGNTYLVCNYCRHSSRIGVL